MTSKLPANAVLQVIQTGDKKENLGALRTVNGVVNNGLKSVQVPPDTRRATAGRVLGAD